MLIGNIIFSVFLLTLSFSCLAAEPQRVQGDNRSHTLKNLSRPLDQSAQLIGQIAIKAVSPSEGWPFFVSYSDDGEKTEYKLETCDDKCKASLDKCKDGSLCSIRGYAGEKDGRPSFFASQFASLDGECVPVGGSSPPDSGMPFSYPRHTLMITGNRVEIRDSITAKDLNMNRQIVRQVCQLKGHRMICGDFTFLITKGEGDFLVLNGTSPNSKSKISMKCLHMRASDTAKTTHPQVSDADLKGPWKVISTGTNDMTGSDLVVTFDGAKVTILVDGKTRAVGEFKNGKFIIPDGTGSITRFEEGLLEIVFEAKDTKDAGVRMILIRK
ncbi:MAG: hypothetical protein HY537_03920 [Deltaproteobacteria bacterium]|nr:hypothetical protein [Deltaproteobacteria bacterium]